MVPVEGSRGSTTTSPIRFTGTGAWVYVVVPGSVKPSKKLYQPLLVAK